MNLFLLLALTSPGGDVTIITAENREIRTRDFALVEIAGRLSIEYSDADNRKQTIPCRDVVEVVFGKVNPRRRFVPEDVLLTTTTGDTWYATILGPVDGGGVRVSTAAFGEIEFQRDHIAALRFPANSADWPKNDPPFSGKSDLLVTKGNDHKEGAIESVDKVNVEYYSKRMRRNLKVAVADLSFIFYMAPADPPPAIPDSLFAIVSTTDGSAVQGILSDMKEGILTFRDLRGKTCRVSAASLTGLHFKNGRVVYVSDRKPSKEYEYPSLIRPADGHELAFDEPYRWKADRNVLGTKLSIRGQEFRKGVGVRAYSSLTYALEGNIRKFQASIGVDDEGLQGGGEVVFEVWVDGERKLAQAAKAGEAALDIDVDVGGAKEIRLVVDFGGNFNVADFADWGSARFIKE